MGSKTQAGWVLSAGLGLLAVQTWPAPHAQTFCDPDEQFFQEKPIPATPRERVNGINLSSCSSGMPCLNQMRAAITATQPLPAAHRIVKREPPLQPCLQSVPTAQPEPSSSQATTPTPAPTP